MVRYQYIEVNAEGEYVFVKKSRRDATKKERAELNLWHIHKESRRPAKKSEIAAYIKSLASEEERKQTKNKCRAIAEYIKPDNSYISVSNTTSSMYIKGVIGETVTILCRVSDHVGRAVLDSMNCLYANSTQEEIEQVKSELAKLQLVNFSK